MDHTDFERLLAADGPFATVYLDARSDAPGAAEKLAVEWRNVRRDLEAAGADAATLEAIDAVVDSGDHGGGETLALVAGHGHVLLLERLPEPPQRSRGRWDQLPWLLPLLEVRQSTLPHVVVLADREGADVVGFTGGDAALERSVDGDTEHIHKGAPGGWSQRRFQERAENTWQDNARDVAELIERAAGLLDARLVVVAGDVRAVQLLREALPAPLAERTVVLDSGSRAANGSIDAIADDVVKQVATVVAEETVETLRRFRAGLGTDLAAEGPARTLEFLRRAVVDTLLVHDDPDDERTAWFGPEAVHVGLDRETVAAMGVDEPREAKLTEVAARAALGTSATVRVVPGAGGPDAGLGVILRHAGTTPDRPV